MSAHSLPVGSGPATPDWHAIEDLLEELAEASKSQRSPNDFYGLLIARIVPVIGAAGGAVWTLNARRELTREFQLNLPEGPAAAGDKPLEWQRSLVTGVISAGEPRVAAWPADPAGSASSREPGIGSLVLVPFRAGPQLEGVVGLAERRALTPLAARGHLRLLAAAVELVEDYHRIYELEQLRQREQTWSAFERFAEYVHRSLDPQQAAFLIANEGRRILDCDRLSVLTRVGKSFRAVATSGVDSLDRKAKVVRLMEQLVARAVAGGDPLWYADDSKDLPVEIEQPLEAYLDESHARALAIVPLSVPAITRHGEPSEPQICGALVAERFQAANSTASLRERTAAIAPHAAMALHNAQTHAQMPLSSLSRLLAQVGWLIRARQLPKTLLAAGLVAACAAALVLIPADFNIESKGELQPERRRDVFASDDGQVDELLVDHGSKVAAGAAVVKLRKPELDLELRRVSGEIQTAEKKLASIRAERLDNLPLPPDARRSVHQRTADEEELKEQLKGLLSQREILEEQRKQLIICSPLSGQALTWNLRELLDARPVQRGQTLLTVGDLDGPWVVEVHVPDNRAGHVLAARDALRKDLDVSFALTSEPGTEYHGHVIDAALATELNDKTEPTMLVTVAFDRAQVAGLRPGATVLSKIQCGRRSLGYVWLHELFEAVQSYLWW